MSKPSAILLLQARMTSSRLPAKAMLTLADMPVAVLAARRATNTGRPLIAAIPDDGSDDALASTLGSHGIAVFRGSVDDVLGRMCGAVADLPDETVAVRLTGDNIAPDGALIEEMLAVFQDGTGHYLRTAAHALPYGMSAEVFTVATLREAAANATTRHAREHVTPDIIERYGDATFEPKDLPAAYGHLRCTLDTVEDYLRLTELVRRLGPDRLTAVSWREICEQLAALPGAPTCRVPRRDPSQWTSPSRYALGTAQLGMAYGAANNHGLPSEAVAADLIRTALDHGIDVLDSARVYGLAERRIGRFLGRRPAAGARLHTKLLPLGERHGSTTASELEARTQASVLRSCRELETDSLDVLMLHRWQDRTLCDGVVWEQLRALRDEGVVKSLGASVSAPEEALQALADPDVTYVQLPFNLLDWRWQAAGVPSAALARPDVVVEARSVLLQGLLSNGPEVWPSVETVDAQAYVRRLEALAIELGRSGRADLCYAYVAAQDWIGSIVVGMETPEQVLENVRLFCAAPLNREELNIVADSVPKAPATLLDPSRWRRAHP